MGLAFAVLGMLLGVVGGVGIIVLAFQESILWGLACLVIPGAALVFVIMNWEEAKTPFFISLAGLPPSNPGEHYSEEQIEARMFTIRHAWKAARQVARECIQR